MKRLQSTEPTAATPGAAQRVWMTLSGDFKKRGAALLHQQCWCWGYDVRREVAGERANLLLELGFERVPAPEGVHGATTYRLRQNDGSTVTLWGFGLCFGDELGGVCVSGFGRVWAKWRRPNGRSMPNIWRNFALRGACTNARPRSIISRALCVGSRTTNNSPRASRALRTARRRWKPGRAAWLLTNWSRPKL